MKVLPTPLAQYDQRWQSETNRLLQAELKRLDQVEQRVVTLEDRPLSSGWTALSGTGQKGGSTVYSAPTISASPTQSEVQAIADALEDAHQTIKSLTDALIAHGILTS